MHERFAKVADFGLGAGTVHLELGRNRPEIRH